MKLLLILIALLLAACQTADTTPAPPVVRISCNVAGVHVAYAFDRVDKTPIGLRAWTGDKSAVLEANCVVVK